MNTFLLTTALLTSSADLSGGYDKSPPKAAAPVPELPPLTTTYLLPNGRLVVVPAGEPLPTSFWQPAPQTMPACPGGTCPVQSVPVRRGLFR